MEALPRRVLFYAVVLGTYPNEQEKTLQNAQTTHSTYRSTEDEQVHEFVFAFHFFLLKLLKFLSQHKATENWTILLQIDDSQTYQDLVDSKSQLCAILRTPSNSKPRIFFNKNSF